MTKSFDCTDTTKPTDLLSIGLDGILKYPELSPYFLACEQWVDVAAPSWRRQSWLSPQPSETRLMLQFLRHGLVAVTTSLCEFSCSPIDQLKASHVFAYQHALLKCEREQQLAFKQLDIQSFTSNDPGSQLALYHRKRAALFSFRGYRSVMRALLEFIGKLRQADGSSRGVGKLNTDFSPPYPPPSSGLICVSCGHKGYLHRDGQDSVKCRNPNCSSIALYCPATRLPLTLLSPKSVAVTQQWTQLESLLLNRYFLLVEIMQLFCTALPLSRLGAAVSFMGAQQLSDLPGLLERLETRGREVGHIASGALGSDASTLLTASEIGINNRYFALYHALSEQLGPNTISNMTVFRAQAA